MHHTIKIEIIFGGEKGNLHDIQRDMSSIVKIKRKPHVAGRVRHQTPKRIEQAVFRTIVEMMYEMTGAEQCIQASIAAIPHAFLKIVSPNVEEAPWPADNGRPWFSRHLSHLRSGAGSFYEDKPFILNKKTKYAQSIHGTPITYIRPETTHYDSPSSYLVFTNGLHHQIVKYSLHMKSDDKPVSTFICCRISHEAHTQFSAETFTYDAEMTLSFLSTSYCTTVSLPPFLSEDLWRKQKQDDKYAAYEEYYAKLISQTVSLN